MSALARPNDTSGSGALTRKEYFRSRRNLLRNQIAGIIVRSGENVGNQ
jgi:hypothetical protein